MEEHVPNNSYPDQTDSNTQQAKQNKVSKQLLYHSVCVDILKPCAISMLVWLSVFFHCFFPLWFFSPMGQIETEKKGAAAKGHDLPSECSLLESIHLELVHKEREFLLREKWLQDDHSKEISALKQENYMLQSKVNNCLYYDFSI